MPSEALNTNSPQVQRVPCLRPLMQYGFGSESNSNSAFPSTAKRPSAIIRRSRPPKSCFAVYISCSCAYCAVAHLSLHSSAPPRVRPDANAGACQGGGAVAELHVGSQHRRLYRWKKMSARSHTQPTGCLPLTLRSYGDRGLNDSMVACDDLWNTMKFKCGRKDLRGY
jgi:hypothetical protein